MRSSLREGGEPHASGSLINQSQKTFETGGDAGNGERNQTRTAEKLETINLFYCRYFVQLSKEKIKASANLALHLQPC